MAQFKTIAIVVKKFLFIWFDIFKKLWGHSKLFNLLLDVRRIRVNTGQLGGHPVGVFVCLCVCVDMMCLVGV